MSSQAYFFKSGLFNKCETLKVGRIENSQFISLDFNVCHFPLSFIMLSFNSKIWYVGTSPKQTIILGLINLSN